MIAIIFTLEKIMTGMVFDFLLVVIFFIAFKMYDIYVATSVIIVGALFQVIITRFVHGKFDKKQLIILALLLVFGGMTLYFHNPIFIKWKPTVVFWMLGIVFFVESFFWKRASHATHYETYS